MFQENASRSTCIEYVQSTIMHLGQRRRSVAFYATATG